MFDPPHFGQKTLSSAVSVFNIIPPLDAALDPPF
jgi:hypothetical protein